MAEDRQIPSKGPVELDVLGQRRDPLLGPDHVGDSHKVVVDDVGKMVGGVAVRFEQHLVIDLIVGDHDIAAQEVVRDCLALGRHRETNDIFFACFHAPLRLF